MQIYSDKKFENPLKIVEAFNSQDFTAAFKEIEQLKKSYYLVGYIRYEAKDVFLGREILSKKPLLYFEVFDKFEKYTPSAFNEEIFLAPKAQISYSEYSSDIQKIKTEISLGNTYEVNYTYDNYIRCSYSAFELYEFLLNKQKTPYTAFIQNEYEQILSFSPELFFRLNHNYILTKPMKGTVKRGSSIKEDLENVEFLKNDEKNRAENVMIVDLLRNDLGKIAKVSGVRVPKLFEVETHETLHQMTSEVEAEIEDGTSLYDIFKALFPCGSVTGAPKRSTMEIIDKLEHGKREVYCGAIGWIYPGGAEFSVPIRILQKSADENFYKYRVGGAVVWDSEPWEEWDETLTKTDFLVSNHKDLKLVETLRVENGHFLYLKEHLERMKFSAGELGFEFNTDIENIIPEKDGMARILLSKDGSFEVFYSDLSKDMSDRVILSEKNTDSRQILLCHKTNFRPWYEDSMRKIRNGEIYDELFMNEKGELTEGARSNILVSADGELYTPPLECGLLNGILRQKMLKEGRCYEKKLYAEDLKNADAVYCINSVRGIKRVYL